jgi:hypothetical protein
MAFEGFKRATRESVGLLIGLASPSGGGKTFSALRLAKGISGGKPFAFIDTEAGRAKHYADQFEFDHADLRAPFRPGSYAEAIEAADEAGYPVIVVDSFSHEHAGEGGLLDWHEEELERMAGTDYAKRERVKMSAWIKPKTSHKRMVSRLLQCRAHLILCFRAEQKTDIVKGRDGKTEIVPKKTLSGFSDWIPVAEKNLLFELTTSFIFTPERPGYPIPIKLQEQHRALFPADKPIDENAGARIAEWAAGGSSRSAPPAPKYVAATRFWSAITTKANADGLVREDFGRLILDIFEAKDSRTIPESVWPEMEEMIRHYAPAESESPDPSAAAGA